MLIDLLGYFRRNINKMNKYQKIQVLKEIKQIQLILEKDLGEAS